MLGRRRRQRDKVREAAKRLTVRCSLDVKAQALQSKSARASEAAGGRCRRVEK